MQVEGVASIVKNQALGVCLWSEWFGFQNRPSNGHWMVGGFQIYHPLLYLLWRFELTGRVEGTSLRLSNMMILQLMVIFFLGREIIQTQWFAFCPGTTFWSPGEWYWFRLRISEVELWELWELWTSTLPAIDCSRLQLQQALAENRLGHRCLVYALEGGGGEGGQSHFMVVKGWCFQHFLGCFCFFLSRWGMFGYTILVLLNLKDRMTLRKGSWLRLIRWNWMEKGSSFPGLQGWIHIGIKFGTLFLMFGCYLRGPAKWLWMAIFPMKHFTSATPINCIQEKRQIQ